MKRRNRLLEQQAEVMRRALAYFATKVSLAQPTQILEPDLKYRPLPGHLHLARFFLAGRS